MYGFNDLINGEIITLLNGELPAKWPSWVSSNGNGLHQLMKSICMRVKVGVLGASN